jgi:hypothetical protein
MKEVVKEVIKRETIWEASDGTQFTSKEECQKYENTAKCVIRTRYSSLIVKSLREEDLLINGCYDNIIDVIKLDDSSDINTVLAMCKLYGYDEEETVCKRALKSDSYILINRGYDNDSFWIMGTIDDILQKISDKLSSVVKVKFDIDDYYDEAN